MIPGMGVHKYKGVEFPLLILSHFHRIFNSGEGERTPSGSATVMRSQSPIKH